MSRTVCSGPGAGYRLQERTHDVMASIPIPCKSTCCTYTPVLLTALQLALSTITSSHVYTVTSHALTRLQVTRLHVTHYMVTRLHVHRLTVM